MPLFKKIYLLLLVLPGLSNVGSAQKIVINEADSSWMGEEIPAHVLSRKKFTFNRRWYQNLVTRFNYYYNANRIMEEVLDGAERTHRDNYDSLLTFYPYAPADFQLFEGRLDSVILNAGIGIEVHDPRGKWIDDLYLLVGKAYYYKQEDSDAIASFKYIIKNMGARDEEDRPELIGSRAFHSEENISIVTPEKKKNPSHPPARNDAFLWLIKAYRQAGEQDAAAALFNSLYTDPLLPERLTGQLTALKAEKYLQNDQPDSALAPLKRAIVLQRDKRMKARWQFILGQLYEKMGKWEEAFQNYGKVGFFSPTPLMAFYAKLNQTRIRVLRDLRDFRQSSRPLLTMARKEKYSRYRSIIYYNLGRLALQAGYPEEGITYLKKSLNYNPGRKKSHFRAYLELANYFYDHYQYRPARAYYDSAAALAPAPIPVVNLRKKALAGVVQNLDVIERADSLRSLAALPRDSLMAYLNGIVRDSLKIRRKRNRILSGPAVQKNGLFGGNDNGKPKEGERNSGKNWYFYNNTAKSRGFSEFKAQWGNRKLADNWRLSHPDQQVIPAQKQEVPVLATAAQSDFKQDEAHQLLQKLMDPLPLGPGQLKQSDSLTMEARYRNVNIFFTQLESDTATLMAIDSLLKWHPENPYLSDIYYKLYLIYSRMPDLAKAAHYKQLLQTRFAGSPYAALLNKKPANRKAKTLATTIMHLYDSAYISYLTGAYEKVSVLRDSARYLDPRNRQKGRFNLLHAMTVLKTRSDSAGMAALKKVIREETADTPIVTQARRILEALRHKDELVEHLMNLQLKEGLRAPAAVYKKDTTETAHPTPPASLHAMASRNGIQAGRKMQAQNIPGQAGVIHSPVEDSAQREKWHAEALERMAKERADSLAVADSLKKTKSRLPTPYKIERQIPYFVILAFNHINGDLIKNTLEAFSEYNHTEHASDSIEVSSFVLSHNRVVLIFRLFKNETGALLYYRELKKKAPVGIIPKVPSTYYRLFFISRSNFILLNNTQDFKGYLNFFYKHYK